MIKQEMFGNVRIFVGLGYFFKRFYIFSFESINYVIKYKENYKEVFFLKFV